MAATGLVDCGNWSVSASWAVPATAVSGIYVARLVGESGGIGASHVVFVVRKDGAPSDILFQTSDTTWHAYNRYGGTSLYGGSGPGGGLSGVGRAYKVSYNRPFTTREYAPEDWVFNAEYPMVRWLERNGYDVSYTTGVDTDRRGSRARQSQGLPVRGPRRVLVEAAAPERGAGARRPVPRPDGPLHLAFFSGNEVFWKTRWEASIDGSGTPYRTLVCYKETHEGAKIDPSSEWTGTWRDPRFSPPSDGGQPENALTGTIFTVNGVRSDSFQVPEAEGKLRFWRNTPTVSGLAAGQVWTSPIGNAGLRVGRGPRQRLPAGGARPALVGDALRCDRGRAGLRVDLRAGQRHSPPRLPQAAERRARVRRRDGAVALGARRQPRPRERGGERRHAAGHGEPPRRHGRSARLAAGRAGAGVCLRGRRRARFRHHVPRERRHRPASAR